MIDFQDGQDRQYPTPTSRGAEVPTLKVESAENQQNLEVPSTLGILDNTSDVLAANWDAFTLQIYENFTIGNSQPHLEYCLRLPGILQALL